MSALWTFPAIILAAMLIAWAAECGQFFISQGLALAVLAWVQTLPEFAVEAVIALDASKDPARLHLITANFTGSLRLFVGLGWPMVYFVALIFGRLRNGKNHPLTIKLDDEHAVAILSLLPALIYFVVIYFKGTLNIFDGLVLGAIYFAYLYLLSRFPPHDKEEIGDLGRVPKYVMRRGYPFNIAWIIGLLLSGGALIYFTAHPFLNSMLAIAVSFGISQFVFVQWVSPFLSEFPEKLSAFYWARKVTKAPMALINFVSSSINQWTILVAMIPFIYAFGLGRIAPIVFDGHQKAEILLTIVQSYLGFLFLASMEFRLLEASALFILWLIQFLAPDIRQGITWVYGAWAAVETVRTIKNLRKRNAFRVFRELVKIDVKRNMGCFLILTLSLLLIAHEAAAEVKLAWEDCVKEALARHPDLISSAEKIKQNKAAKEIVRSATLPQVTGNAAENTSNGIGVNASGSSGQGITSLQGGSASSEGANTRYTYGGTIQQLLFDGFKTSYSLSGAERTIWASRYSYDVTSSNIRLRLRQAFANLLSAQELVKVTEEIEARRKQNLELVKSLYEGGREHKGSLMTSEADLAQAAYEVEQAKRNIYLFQVGLIKELGRSTYSSAGSIIADGDFEIKTAERTKPDFEKVAESNPLLRQLIAQKEAAKYGVRSAKAGLYPQIFVTGGESNSNTNVFPDQNQWSIGTTLTFPIFDGGNTIASIAKARAALGQAEADERSGRDGVILTMANTWTGLQNAEDNVMVQNKFLDAARERARIAEAEYSIGLMLFDNWIIIEDNYVNARKSYVNAQNAALIAEANWVQARGGTLDYD